MGGVAGAPDPTQPQKALQTVGGQFLMMAREENVQKRGVAVTDAMNGAARAQCLKPLSRPLCALKTHLGPAMPQLPLGDDKIGQSEHS